MNRCFAPHFPSEPRPIFQDWFRFDDFDYVYSPSKPVNALQFGRTKARHCFYRQAPATAAMKWWLCFSNDPENRFSDDRTTWYELYRSPRIYFEIDNVYCGEDFIMVKIADPEWPRWMVVWIHESMMHVSRMGFLWRRPKYPIWTATHRAAFKCQSVIDICLYLAHHSATVQIRS